MTPSPVMPARDTLPPGADDAVDRRALGRLRSRVLVLEAIHRADIDHHEATIRELAGLEETIGELEARIRARQ